MLDSLIVAVKPKPPPKHVRDDFDDDDDDELVGTKCFVSTMSIDVSLLSFQSPFLFPGQLLILSGLFSYHLPF